MSQVIRIDSVRRSAIPSSKEDARMEGFMHALKALQALKSCSMMATIIAIENWADCGMLTQAQADALMEFHGWGSS